MKFRKEIIIFSLLLMLFAISAASANENIVNDEVISNEISTVSPSEDLQDELGESILDENEIGKENEICEHSALGDDNASLDDYNSENTSLQPGDNVTWIITYPDWYIDYSDVWKYGGGFCWDCYEHMQVIPFGIEESISSQNGLITNITFKPVGDNQICITINVTNMNSKDLTDVKTIDCAVARLNYVNYSLTKGKYEKGTWTIGNLESGKSVFLNIFATVKEIPFGYVVKTSSSSTDYLTVLYRNVQYLHSFDNADDLIKAVKYDKMYLTEDRFIRYGEPASFTVNFYDGDVTGNVRFEIDNISRNAKIINGKATLEVTGLNCGDHDVQISYDGDNHTIDPIKTTISVYRNSPFTSVVANDIEYGNDAVITVNLAQNVSGNVKITVKNKSQRVKITNGTATATFTGLNAGTYDVAVSYAGNTNYYDDIRYEYFDVIKSAPIVSVNASDVVFGERATINVDLAKNVPGNVRVTINGVTKKAKITNGKATFSFSGLKAGSYDVKVYYAGNVNYNAQSIKTTLTVAKANPITSVSVENINVGETAAVTVKMAKNVNGNVRITVNGVTYKVKIIDGIASLNVSGLKAGIYKVSVVYAGNANFNAKTATANLAVSKSSPGITISTSSRVERIEGDYWCLNIEYPIVIVKIAQDAPGNVKFSIDGMTYKVPIVNGVAIIPLDWTYGSYVVEATYAGNYKYFGQTITEAIFISYPYW